MSRKKPSLLWIDESFTIKMLSNLNQTALDHFQNDKFVIYGAFLDLNIP